MNDARTASFLDTCIIWMYMLNHSNMLNHTICGSDVRIELYDLWQF